MTLIILSSAPKTNHLLFVSKAAHFTDLALLAFVAALTHLKHTCKLYVERDVDCGPSPKIQPAQALSVVKGRLGKSR